MKPNRLPPTDIANCASLDDSDMLKSLLAFRATKAPSVSYTGVRSCHDDCFALRAGALPMPPLDLATFERQVERACNIRTPNNIAANLQVARGLHNLALEREITGRREPLLVPHLIGGYRVEIWSRVILEIAGDYVIPFIDPRRSRTQLNERGLRVAFSLMHESTRAVLGDDMPGVRLAVIQLDDPLKGERKARIIYSDEYDLYSFDELKAMLTRLHNMYDAVCAGREEDLRRHADEDVPDGERTEMEKLWRKA